MGKAGRVGKVSGGIAQVAVTYVSGSDRRISRGTIFPGPDT